MDISFSSLHLAVCWLSNKFSRTLHYLLLLDSGVLTCPNLSVRLPRRSRSPSAPTDPLRRPKRRKRAPAGRDPRRSSYPALSAAYSLVLYKLARACRARCSPPTPVFPYGTGVLVVGD